MGKEESKVESRVKWWAKELGGFSRKYTSPGKRGVPDQIAFLPHGVVFVETKTPKGRLSKLQKKEIARIKALAIPVFVCDSENAVNSLFTVIQKEMYPNAIPCNVM